MTSQLVGSDFTSGAQLPKYANGRMLTADDLAMGQAALWTQDALIGQAAGHGVVNGLWVTAAATSLTIAPGLAISPSGQPARLASTVTLPLAASMPGPVSSTASFSACPSPSAGVAPSITAGEYLLTVRPASQPQGLAPLASTPGSGAPAGCTAQWTVQGVSFNAITLQVPITVAGVNVTTGNRRNLLAHWFFGTAQLAQLGVDPFGFNPAYGGIDGLDPADLTSGDVPLAVFSFDGQSISDLDNWSVRRRITAPDPLSADPAGVPWSAVVSDRRVADGQARFLQFQDQAMDLVASGTAGTTAAADVFGLLPPVGFLPAGLTAADAARVQALAQLGPPSASQPGFNVNTFFGALAQLGGLLTWELADLFLQQSWLRDPVPATPAAQPQSGQSTPVGSGTVLLTYYYVLENAYAPRQPPSPGVPPAGPAFYVVFVKNYQPVRAAGPQPDLSYLVPLLLDDLPNGASASR